MEAGEAAEGSTAGCPEDVAALAELVGELSDESRSRALTHSSWARKRHHSWGRLAFLGDSVLGLAIAEELFKRFPRSDIGRLTKVHGQAVSGRACARIAELLEVPRMLTEMEPDSIDGAIRSAELVQSERALASVTESLIGACYLEFGIERTDAAVLAAFEHQIALATDNLLDFKSALQENLARTGRTVSYRVIGEQGPPHDRRFEVEALVDDEQVGVGYGSSKKAAEQAAAAEALGEEQP